MPDKIHRGYWALRFLEECGYPTTRQNRIAIVAWEAAEGGPQFPQAKFNPLNTTLRYGGSWQFNWVGVQNYPSLQVGLEATKRTLKRTKLVGYAPIRRALKKGDSAQRVLEAVENSTWGTGGLALRIIPDVTRDLDDDRQTYWHVPIGQ